ncbi:NINE protein [Desulforamulus ferrireducens]
MLELEIEKNNKKKSTSWVLFLFLGGFGAHKFYLNQKKLGFIYMGITFGFIFYP